MQATRKFLGEQFVNEALAGNPPEPFESGRHDFNREMGFTTRPGPRMTLMARRFIRDR